MRGARSTLVMLVVFLGLAAYVYFIEMERRPASETPPNEQLFELGAEDIQALTVKTGSDETVLHRTADDEWELTSPIEGAADAAAVSSITSRVSTLEIRRVVQEEPVDLEPFGLSSPVVEVSFTIADDETDHRLLIGETSPTGTDRYAKVADEDRVILVAASTESALNKSTFDLRDKTILNVETADVDRLEIDRAGSVLQFSKSDNDWRLVQPWDVRADFSTVEGLVGRIARGQMRSVVTEDINAEEESAATDDDDDDSPDYGLAAAALTATLGAGSASATLAIGSQSPRGEHYAQDTSRSIVFTIERSLVTDVEREALEYRRRDLFSFRSFNATRLEVERPETTVVFEKTADTGEDTETAWTRTQPEAGAIERSDMDDLLSKISNLRADSFVESRTEVAISDADIIATVRVTFGDEETEESVVFWRNGDDTYAVSGDEPGAGVVESGSVDSAFDALDQTQSKAPEA